MKSTWKKYLLYAGYILIASGLLYGLLRLILTGYSVSWTGFGERTLSNGDVVGEKTLWNWMELLIIPLVLALGAFFLNRSERAVERQIADDRRKEDRILADERAKLEREIAKDRQQEAALQAYIDRMSELLLKEKSRTTEIQEVRDVARTRTVSVMRGLDPNRNNQVIQFLRDANLIVDENSILNNAYMQKIELPNLDLCSVYLNKANLSEANLEGALLLKANLEGASLGGINLRYGWLPHANLQNAYLDDANLYGASLAGANLKNAFMPRANLQDVYMEEADLQNAVLKGANLQGADLTAANLLGADLTGANLKSAKLSDGRLASVESLKGATMPDGTIHE